MNLLPVNLLGREADLAGPLVLGTAVLAKQLTERLLARGAARGRRSGWFGTVCLFVLYVGSLVLALWCLATRPCHAAARSGPCRCPDVAAMAGGALLWALAASLRIWAMAHLREQFSYLIEVREDRRLVDTGPYAIIRHPLHLAFALEVTSFALAAWTAWALLPAVLVWIVVLVRNRTEEAALRAHFGGAWDEYAARVPSMNLLRGLAGGARGSASRRDAPPE